VTTPTRKRRTRRPFVPCRSSPREVGWADGRHQGHPVGYDLVGPKTGQEREAAFELACAQPASLLFADGGFGGAEYERTMNLINVTLITPDKHKLGARPPAEIAEARIRLVVESVFSNLKGQVRRTGRGPESPGGGVGEQRFDAAVVWPTAAAARAPVADELVLVGDGNPLSRRTGSWSAGWLPAPGGTLGC
jgi:hypothetical protein